MTCGLRKIISSICQSHNLLPDDLHEKSGKESTIKPTAIEEEITKEFDGLLSSIAKKYNKFQFDRDNSHSILRRILPKEGEFTEEISHLNEVIVHIYISYEVFRKFTKYLDRIVNEFRYYQKSKRNYFQHYVRIQNTVDALEQLCREHERYLNEIDNILNDRDSAWFVDMPDPQKMIDLIQSAFIDLENGVLSAPLLRSYIEIDSMIVLENTVNDLLRKTDRYKEKKILLQPTMRFSDIVRLLAKFEILDERDIDIISRIYKVHIGAFFDRLVAWYLLFYLYDIKRNPASIQTFFTNSIEEFINKGKLKVVSDTDVVTDYSRFQSTSKQFEKLKKG